MLGAQPAGAATYTVSEANWGTSAITNSFAWALDQANGNLGAVFDKLDAQRVEGLIRMVNDHRFGQIFVSDTHPERTAELLKALDQESVVHELTHS